jgi:ABC-type sugar transport system ATPase subunit
MPKRCAVRRDRGPEKSQGVGIIYISHRMEEIFKITDRISVLRDGQYRGTLNTAETNEDEITQMMIGRKSLDLSRNHEHVDLGPRRPCASRGCPADTSIRMLRSKCARARCWASTALSAPGGPRSPRRCSACASRRPGVSFLKGEEVTISSPIDAIAKGISLVPESRKEQGLVLGMNCRDNMTLPQVDDLKRRTVRRRRRGDLDLRPVSRPSADQGAQLAHTVGNLSGGNQQKIVIGKWLSMQPEVLIVDEPTRGIDVGSKSEIHNLLRELAKQGYAVIVISSEMPEVLHVSDRIVAMYHGRIMREFTAEEVTEDSLIQAISG